MMLASLAGVSAPVARVRGRSGRCSARCGAARVATVRCSAAQPVELSRSALLRGSAAFGALVAAGVAAPPSRAAAAVGESAPAFSLPASTGGSISLADLTKSGKYTVLYFYNQDLSPGCSLEAARFQQAAPAFAAANAQVVGVSMDSLEKHAEFCKQKGIGFALLSDSAGDVSASYGADLNIPLFGKFSDRQTFLIDTAGVIRAKWLERDGSMKSVKTPEHTEQVLAAIAAL